MIAVGDIVMIRQQNFSMIERFNYRIVEITEVINGRIYFKGAETTVWHFSSESVLKLGVNTGDTIYQYIPIMTGELSTFYNRKLSEVGMSEFLHSFNEFITKKLAENEEMVNNDVTV